MNVSIKLDRLIGAEIHKREVNGEVCDCISIPLKWNGISCFRDTHYYMNLYMYPQRPDSFGHTHYLNVRYPKELRDWYNKVKEAGLYDRLKFIGNVYGKSFDKYSPDVSFSDVKKALEK